MKDPRIEVFVQSVPGRDHAHERCFASIEASDIGHDYTVCENPPGLAPIDHWRATLERAARASSELVLVLEDDVLVNRHLIYNVLTWKWPHDRRYGAGWLYCVQGYRGGKDRWFDHRAADWWGTQAVLYRTAQLPRFIEAAWQILHERYLPNGWDNALVVAIHRHQLRLRVHGPSLVEHLWEEPSTCGHVANWMTNSSRGTFSLDWRRPPGDRNRR